MRKFMLIANSLMAVFFILFLAYTFFARQHVVSLARQYAAEKTQQFAEPGVEKVERILQALEEKQPNVDSKAKKAIEFAAGAGIPIDKEKIDGIKSRMTDALTRRVDRLQEELARYRKDPVTYIIELTKTKAVEIKPDPSNPVAFELAKWKRSVYDYFNSIFRALIVDLRIFALTNVIASIIAAAMAYFSRGKLELRHALISLLLFGSVIYCIYFYINHMTFFNIMFKTHLGLLYPILVASTFIRWYEKFLQFFGSGDRQETSNRAEEKTHA